jgi:hypothetical protein
MEPPADSSAEAIAVEKKRLLQRVDTLTLTMEDVTLGQFTGNTFRKGGEDHTEPGYLEDPTVPEGSRCPTFAMAVLKVHNARWEGVPFVMSAGRAHGRGAHHLQEVGQRGRRCRNLITVLADGGGCGGGSARPACSGAAAHGGGGALPHYLKPRADAPGGSRSCLAC